MNPKQIVGDLVNINICFLELGGFYAREVAQRIGASVLDALDCFGDDPVEDAEIRSEIWEKLK